VPVPTALSVTPARGAADGRTFVEVRGSGFRVPPEGVRVTFGGRRATHVLVYDAEELTCLTPVGDPADEVLVGVFSAGVFSAPGHRVAEGARLRFDEGAPAPLRAPHEGAAVPYYAVDVLPGVSFSVSTSPSGAPLAVEDGPATARTEASVDVVVQNLDAAGSPVPGESAALAAGFSFRRPDLGVEGALRRLEAALVADLRRVHPNVSLATHEDYDAQTGDYVLVQPVAGFPAVVLSNPRLRENRMRLLGGPWRTVTQAGTRFVERRGRKVYDARYLLVVASDDRAELLNLHEALALHFEKTGQLLVRRGPDSGPDDEVAYDMQASFVETTSDVQGGASTSQTLGMEVVVFACVCEASEGAPQETSPGIPMGMHHEATVAHGYTLETPDLDVREKL
jgi:hypothetical protein